MSREKTVFGSTIDADAIGVVALSRTGLFKGLIICMNVVMVLSLCIWLLLYLVDVVKNMVL